MPDREITLVGGLQTLSLTSDNVEVFTNASGQVAVGDAVYINGVGSVAKAANTVTDQEAIGLVLQVVDLTNCKVITRGLIEGVLTGATANTRYYLGSTAGGLTTTKPSGSSFAQVVGIAVNATDLLVLPQVGITEIAPSLDTAYDNGATITTDAGPVILTGTTSSGLRVNDNVQLTFGTGDDVLMFWDAAQMQIWPAVDGNNLWFGKSDGTQSFDMFWVGSGPLASMAWNQAADSFGTGGLSIDFQDAGSFLVTNTSVDITGTTSFNIGIADNTAPAFVIFEGANDYFEINTTDGAEFIRFGNTATNPNFVFLGSGAFELRDGVPGAFKLSESLVNDYFDIDTTNLAEAITFGNTTTNPDYTFLGSGTTTFNGVLSTAGTFVDFDLQDNATSVFQITEGLNEYLTIDTTDLSELITFGSVDVTFLSGGDITLEGNPNTNRILFRGVSNSLSIIGIDTQVGDDDVMSFGADGVADSSIRWVSVSNQWLFNNPNVVGETVFGLGTTTTATEWRIDDSASSAILQVLGNGFVRIAGTRRLSFGNSDDVTINWSGTQLQITPAADGTNLWFGNGAGTQSFDLSWFGSTGSNKVLFDSGTDTASFAGLTASFTVPDNTASAFSVAEGANNYVGVTTTNTAEVITFGNATTNPDYTFSGSGTLTTNGVVTHNLPDNTDNTFVVQEGANNYIEVLTLNTVERINFGNATINPDYFFLGTGFTSFSGPVLVDNTVRLFNSADPTNVATFGFVYVKNGEGGTTSELHFMDDNGEITQVTQNGAVRLEYISVRRTTNSSSQANEFNPLATTAGGTVVTDSFSDNTKISFASASGTFTVTDAGAYEFNVHLFLTQNANGLLDGFFLEKNGVTTVYTANAFVHATVDPVGRSFSIILDLAASDTVQMRVDSTGANTVIAETGCCITVKRVG